jgi:DNA-binding beta-propeller fold protein YncE
MPGDPPQERTFHYPGDVDWVRFDAVAGQRYLLEVAAVVGVQPVLAFFAADGQTPLTNPAPDAQATDTPFDGLGDLSAPLTWRAPASETYYLRVREQNGRGGSGYFYTLALTPLSHNHYLPQVIAGQTTVGDRVSQKRVVPGHAGRAALPAAGNGASIPVRSLAVDPATGHLYLLGEDTVTLYDPADDRVLARASVGRAPGGIALDGPAGRVYVASGKRRAVLALDAATLELRGVATGFRQPGGLAVADGRLFVADTSAGTVHVLATGDPSFSTGQGLREITRTEVGAGPYAVALLPSVGRVFVALTGGDGVAMLDSMTGELLATTRLGGLGYPQGLVADDATGLVYTVYTLAPRYRQIAVIDGVAGAVVGLIPATLDRPMSDVEALAHVAGPSGAEEGVLGRGRLLVGGTTEIMVYDLARGQWLRPLPLPWGGPVPIFGLAVDAPRGVVYAASLTDRAGRWARYSISRPQW